jgi:hypothetical protein
MAIQFWNTKVGEETMQASHTQVHGVRDTTLRHSEHRAKMLLSASRAHPDQGQTKHHLTTKNSRSLSWPNLIECRYQDFKGRSSDAQVQHEFLVSITLKEFFPW